MSAPTRQASVHVPAVRLSVRLGQRKPGGDADSPMNVMRSYRVEQGNGEAQDSGGVGCFGI